MRNISIFLLIHLVFVGCSVQKREKKIQIIDKDAAWCWFSDPRAIRLHSSEQGKVISGGVSKDGSIIAFSFNAENNAIERGIIHPGLESDDHDNPAFLELPDGKILTFYTRHHNDDLFFSKTIKAGDITKWEAPHRIRISNKNEEKRYDQPRYTYANPFMLSAEKNRIYLFGRWMGFKPTMIWSDDYGESWSNSRVVVCPQPYDSGNRPYVKYYSDGNQRIHMTFTDGHPRKEPNNSVYYAYYEDGAFHKADGSIICTIDNLPFEPKEATLVYQGNTKQGRAWVYDIKADDKGLPAIAYACYPSEKDHIYHYIRYDGESWDDYELCNSGHWFPQTPEGEKEREPHYSGGLTIDGNNVTTVYLSRKIQGTFEIEEWHLSPEGNWINQPVTSTSILDQVRPLVPWGCRADGQSLVLWMENERYVHYTSFKTKVKGLIR